MNRDRFLQRGQQTSPSDANESVEPASASRQDHRQQAQQSADRLDQELARLADLYSPPDLVNRGAQ
jgi:hypothetical protein